MTSAIALESLEARTLPGMFDSDARGIGETLYYLSPAFSRSHVAKNAWEAAGLSNAVGRSPPGIT